MCTKSIIVGLFACWFVLLSIKLSAVEDGLVLPQGTRQRPECDKIVFSLMSMTLDDSKYEQLCPGQGTALIIKRKCRKYAIKFAPPSIHQASDYLHLHPVSSLFPLACVYDTNCFTPR